MAAPGWVAPEHRWSVQSTGRHGTAMTFLGPSPDHCTGTRWTSWVNQKTLPPRWRMAQAPQEFCRDGIQAAGLTACHAPAGCNFTARPVQAAPFFTSMATPTPGAKPR